MGVTIKEIAEMAGVHRSTVDKVLHNRPGVSDPVRQRVQKIIDQCNYQANPIGKALKMQERKLHIKIILLEVDARAVLQRGIEEKLRQYASFQIFLEYVIISYPDVQAQKKALDDCVQEKVDGVIMSPINTPEIVQKINACVEAGIFVVTVNTDIKGSKRLCFVGQDGFKSGKIAGRLMGELLQGKGKVVIFTSDESEHQSFPFGTREEGFRKLVEEYYPEIKLLPSIYTQEKSQMIYREMTKICQQEEDIAGIFITCGGVKVVGEVLESYEWKNTKLICYENYPEILELLKRNTITMTLDSKIEEQGRKSLEILLDKLIYDRTPTKKHLYSEIEILLRESL